MIELLSRQFCLARHYPLLTLKETCRSTVCKRNISRSVAYHHSFNKSHVVKTTIGGYGGICIPSLRRPVLAAVYGQAFHTSPKRHLHPIFWLLAKPRWESCINNNRKVNHRGKYHIYMYNVIKLATVAFN